jgi:UDP-3-O-[3-hydroxymyristoyl] glucosamine N-acyltransferase
MEFSLGQIAELISGKVEGDSTLKVSRLDKIQEGLAGRNQFFVQ